MAFVTILAAALAASAARMAVAQDRVVAGHYPPIMNAEDAGAPGFAVAMLTEAAQRLGRDLDVQFLPFPRAMSELAASPNVMMAALFRSPAREDKFIWVAEIYTMEMHFVALGRRIDTWDEARELQVIGVEFGSTGDDLLTARGFANVFRSRGPNLTAQMLYAGRVEAMFLPIEIVRFVAKGAGSTDALVHGDGLYPVPIYLVASPGTDTKIIEMYRAAFAEMRDDGTMARILLEYGIQ